MVAFNMGVSTMFSDYKLATGLGQLFLIVFSVIFL